jgi:hypothetical protein
LVECPGGASDNAVAWIILERARIRCSKEKFDEAPNDAMKIYTAYKDRDQYVDIKIFCLELL